MEISYATEYVSVFCSTGTCLLLCNIHLENYHDLTSGLKYIVLTYIQVHCLMFPVIFSKVSLLTFRRLDWQPFPGLFMLMFDQIYIKIYIAPFQYLFL